MLHRTDQEVWDFSSLLHTAPSHHLFSRYSRPNHMSVCVHVHVVYVCMLMYEGYTCHSIHMKIRGQAGIGPCLRHRTCWGDCPTGSLDSPTRRLSSWDYWCGEYPAQLYIGSGDLNAGPHMRTICTPPTELSLRPWDSLSYYKNSSFILRSSNKVCKTEKYMFWDGINELHPKYNLIHVLWQYPLNTDTIWVRTPLFHSISLTCVYAVQFFMHQFFSKEWHST